MKKAIVAIATLFPFIAFAQAESVLYKFQSILNLATPIVVSLALLYFFWGLANYILNSGDEEKKSEGRNIMIWGIIALTVMVSVWGLVRVLAQTFQIQGGSPPVIQQLIPKI